MIKSPGQPDGCPGLVDRPVPPGLGRTLGQAIYRGRRVTLVSAWGVEGQLLAGVGLVLGLGGLPRPRLARSPWPLPPRARRAARAAAALPLGRAPASSRRAPPRSAAAGRGPHAPACRPRLAPPSGPPCGRAGSGSVDGSLLPGPTHSETGRRWSRNAVARRPSALDSVVLHSCRTTESSASRSSRYVAWPSPPGGSAGRAWSSGSAGWPASPGR
jgi:hypothetical protein